MENNIQERRQSARFRINYLMKYCKTNGKRTFQTFFNDVSEKGLKFLAKEHLPNSTPVFIELPHDSQPLRLNGKVVWNNALDKNFYELGVSFEGVTGENREVLNQYIRGLREKIKN